ncbi:glycoside hydrolase family 36 protein [Dictyobacter formicarum]|uniref:Alpha-galactosidase n=1 Tax=Dictyobacter formicarum TaxID=2778368 RepID=A0ABQ3VU43_9CHLR|nr:glycoside hydrolase family 36 protein [Dictyobacter formicarum]GHO88826.1 hypothetical protein KSZ_68320 [Dictyobacter formicarum]
MDYLDVRRVPDAVTVQLEDSWVSLLQHGEERWQQQGIEVLTEFREGQQAISLSAPGMAVLRVALRWRQPVSSRLRFLGDHWDRGYGDLEWRGLVPERLLPWYFLTFNGQETHGYGVKTGARAICFWQVDASGVTLWLDVRNGGAGVELGERVLPVAEIVSREGRSGESAFQAARAFCSQLCERPVLPKQPVYGSNNWYYAYGNSSHREILADTKLLAELAPNQENRPYMVIDDGWQLCSLSSYNGGPWRQGNYLFPDMGRLAGEMREMGVRPGIWMRPLLTLEKVPAEWILKVEHRSQNNVGLVLDPSQPAVLEHVQEDICCLHDWGFELIKHDFSTYDLFGRWGFQMGAQLTEPGWHFADRSRTSAEIILSFYRAIAEASADSVIIGCNTIGHLSAGLFELQRTGDDTSGREWERTRFMGINTLAFRMPQHNTFFAADADCVGLTNQIPWELNQRWLDLLARSGTPLFVSAAPDAVGPAQREALIQAFTLAAQERIPAEPLDWLDTTCPASWQLDGQTTQYDWYEANGVRLY